MNIFQNYCKGHHQEDEGRKGVVNLCALKKYALEALEALNTDFQQVTSIIKCTEPALHPALNRIIPRNLLTKIRSLYTKIRRLLTIVRSLLAQQNKLFWYERKPLISSVQVLVQVQCTFRLM